MNIRIEAIDNTFGTRVFIDDVEQTEITQVVFIHAVNKKPYLRLDRLSKVDGEFIIEGDTIKRFVEEYNK